MHNDTKLEPKKLALIYMLRIMNEYSDYEHPLKQEEIASLLEKNFDLTLERKAIGRNLELLDYAGFEMSSAGKGKGVYFSGRGFTDAELRLLIDGILSSRYVTANHSKELIEKLAGLSSKYFNSHVKHAKLVNKWNKTENQHVFYNIEVLDEAIEHQKKVSYSYLKYDENKKLKKTSEQVASPYQMILHNQRYYLMAYSDAFEHMVYHRLDKITDIKILDDRAKPVRSVPGFEAGIDYQRFSTAMPYMYSDEPEVIEMVCDKRTVDQVIDWFGTDINVRKIPGDEEHVSVILKASLMAMEHWAMQYIKHVEVKKPEKLRNMIRDAISEGTEKYFRDEK